MDRYSYVSPSRIKVLVVPLNGLSSHQFNEFFTKISSFNEMRLLDIPPIPELKYFNPQSFPNGRLLFDFLSTLPDNESIFLHDFEPFRKTFIVLGLGSFSSSSTDCNMDLNKLYPGTIVQNCIYFNTPEDDIKKLSPASDHSMKSTFYYNESKLTLMETIMCEVSRNFLYHLDSYASSYENITLRSPVSISDSQLLAKTITKAQKRISSGSSSLKVSFNGNGGQIDAKNKNQVRNNGRQSKLLASFYLLAGKYVDSLSNFTDALLYLRKSEDSMWLASALEGIGVLIVLLNYIEVTYQLPNAVLATVLLLTKGKIRDMSIDNVSRKVSGESIGTNGTSSKQNTVSPRTSSSGRPSFNIGTPALGSGPDLSMIAIPELIKQLSIKVNFFFHTSTEDFENTVPDIVYIESILRQINLMIYVYNYGVNIQADFFKAVIQCEKLEKCGNTTNPWFSKYDIVAEVDKIFSLQLVDLNITDQCRIYSSIASIYGPLNMTRKRAFILRTIAVAIIPKLEHEFKEDGDDINSEHKDLLQVSKTFGDGGIKELIKVLFVDYGLVSQPEVSIDDSSSTNRNWSTIHIQLIRIGIKVFEAIKDYSSLIQLYCISLTRYLNCLPPDDQIRIKTGVDRICQLNPDLSLPYFDPFLIRSVVFVPNHSSKSELIPMNKSSKGQSTQEQTIFNPFEKGQLSCKKDLLISGQLYQLRVALQNPFAFEIDIREIDIISSMEVETISKGIRSISNQTRVVSSISRSSTQSKLTINNPKLRGDPRSPYNSAAEFAMPGGAQANTTSSQTTTSYVIGPFSRETFIIPFKPISSGSLVISGFKVGVSQCTSQEFPIILKEKVPSLSKLLDNELLPSSNPFETITYNLNNIPKLIKGRVETINLELDVIGPQPSLSLIDILLTNSWLMLLEGEKIGFSVKLINLSDQVINYLSFSFWDSTIDTITGRLNSKLPASEIYELEWYLLKFKSFTISNKQMINDSYKIILPGQEITIDYEVTGKKNMTELKMILEYANNEGQTSYLKSLEIPINVTVTPSIDIINFEVIPLCLNTINGFTTGKSFHSKNLESLKTFIIDIVGSDSLKISDYCLMIFDLRNSWSEQLTIDIGFNVFNSEQSDKFVIEDTLRPRKTTRYILPIKKVSFKELNFDERIPSLRNKQYIKDYLMSDKEERQMKTTFWLRENIISRFEGKWFNDSRKGSIDFRNFKLTNKMLDSLIYSKISIINTIALEVDGELVDVTKKGNNYYLNIEDFYVLKTYITNYSDIEVTGILRHLPFPAFTSKDVFSIEEKILVDGLLQSKLPQSIQPNKSITVELSFVVLERGEYEWGIILDAINTEETFRVSGREQIHIVAS